MHPESLLNIPLVRHLRTDPIARLEPRRLDRWWFYNGSVPISVNGFNHFQGRIFYSARSFMAQWLADSNGSARDLNEGDFLVKEVLMAVHDYLHVWSLALVNRLHPELRLGVAPIGVSNVEDFVFCHLVTEAAATVGLDYWYLSTVDLDRVVPIGSTVSGLTVCYHERFLAEYRAFNPDFAVQERGFFERLCDFYCDGVFRGFDVGALKRSARVLSWLKHELTYGVRQRQYIRQWLRFLSGGAVRYDEAGLAAPVEKSAPWKRRLVSQVGEALWEKVKDDRLVADGIPIDPSAVWRSPTEQRPDFRFLNANLVDPERVRGMAQWENADQNFRFYLWQVLSSFDYDSFDPELRALVPSLASQKNPHLVERLFRDQKRMPSLPECADLLTLN